jgi:D-alanine-D-alanine ligase
LRIGFTYDLKDDYLQSGYTQEQVAEFDSTVTIDAVCEAIERAGHSVECIGNAAALSKKLLAGARWDLVFNICEGMYGTGREALVPAMLDAWQIPYTFSEPLVHALTLHKGITKQLLQASGLSTTEFCLMNSPEDFKGLQSPYPYFVKAVSEGTGKGITPNSKVHSLTELKEQASLLITEFKQPVIVEPFLTGREVPVGVLGTGDSAFCLGVMDIGFTDKADSDIHSYYNKANCEEAAVYSPAKDEFAAKCADLALQAHKVLNIKDACRVDIRSDSAGEPQIMEINSLPGLMPARSDLILLAEMFGYTYQQVIEAILKSAMDRICK